MAKKKAKRAKPGKKKPAKAGKKKSSSAKSTRRKAAVKPKRRAVSKGRATAGFVAEREERGTGARSGGQSGDTQGLSASAGADSESVEELLEEGQSFEAEVLNGIERASDADEEEVRTREVPEDDVPEEYKDQD
jgi:hypothetical protein